MRAVYVIGKLSDVSGPGLEEAGRYSAWTSPATPWTPRYSDITSYAEDSSMLGHHQLCRLLLGAWILCARELSGHTSPHFTLQTSPAMPGTPRCSDITSYTGDSSVLGHHQLRRRFLDARALLATLGTPRCSNIASCTRDSSLSDIASYAEDSSVLRRC